jgi:cyanophycinase
VVGAAQVITFTNPDNSRYQKNEKLGARDLKISIYLPGDTFSIN